MKPSGYRVRRATVDDLGGLRRLWLWGNLASQMLEQRVTEFQLVEDESGQLLGTIGLRVAGQEGQLHSEVFTQPAEEEQLRPLVWERLQVVARNHGLTRLGTRERAPFWRQAGFRPATPELQAELPPALGQGTGKWQVLRLRETPPEAALLEREFDLFMKEQARGSQRALHQGRLLKVLATLLGLAFAALVLGGALYLARRLKLARGR